jgi:hypothetical protein
LDTPEGQRVHLCRGADLACLPAGREVPDPDPAALVGRCEQVGQTVASAVRPSGNRTGASATVLLCAAIQFRSVLPGWSATATP